MQISRAPITPYGNVLTRKGELSDKNRINKKIYAFRKHVLQKCDIFVAVISYNCLYREYYNVSK